MSNANLGSISDISWACQIEHGETILP